MINRIARYLTILLILALVLYVVLMNREPITIRLSASDSYTAMGGVVLIGIYTLGLLSAGLIGLFFGIKTYFRERGFLSRERSQNVLRSSLAKARGLVAAQEWQQARSTYEYIVKKNPQDSISRVELSRVLQGLGDQREALRVLDEARSLDPENIEILFRAAELNIALKNRTAAIDNLALILYQQPSKKAALMARDLSEDLERYDDALEYEQRVQSFGITNDEHDKVIGRLEYKRIAKELEKDPAMLRDKLIHLVKKRPHCHEALLHLVKIDEERGAPADAAVWCVRAARESEDLKLWRKASTLWLTNNMPQQALAAARAAAKESRGNSRLNAEIELIRVYLALNMLEEAKSAISGFTNLARDYEVVPNDNLLRELLALQGLCFTKIGDTQRASAALTALSEGLTTVDQSSFDSLNGAVHDGIAPRLSTP